MKKQDLIFILFWLAIAIGMESEFYIYTADVLSGSEYGIAFICASLLLLYVLPAAFLLRHWRKIWQVDSKVLYISLLAGAFIGGWLSANGNHLVDIILALLGFEGETFKQIGAISAPFIEEPAKAIAAFSSLLLLNKWKDKAVLIAGACAGLGFQIIEDFAYINNNASEGLAYSVADIFGRMTGAISSHWVYSALFVYGIFLLIKKKDVHYGLFFTMSALILHGIWNSPIIDLPTPIPLVGPIIIAAGLYLFYLAYHKAEDK